MHLPAYYEFSCPVRIVSGCDALERIPALLADLKASRPLVVTDRGVVAAGLLRTVENAWGGRLVPAAVADEVPPDSEVSVVKRLAGRYREAGCDSLVAVGGGSVMDTAKGVNMMVSEEAPDLMRLAGAGVLKRPLKPLVAVPTTAGTGSEVTLVAVIADHERRLKLLFTSPFLLPHAAVLDPRMTVTLPPAMTAATAMDALAHAVEAYTCLGKNPLSDAAAFRAVALIGSRLPEVMRHPGDAAGRSALAGAAALAGMAFSNSMVGMVHTLGHAVGAVCGVPHGVCMAVLLPYGLEYNMHRNGRWTAELLLPLCGADTFSRIPRHMRAHEVVAAVRRLNQMLREATGGAHPRCFREVVDGEGRAAVPRERLAAVAEVAIDDASISYNPEELDRGDILTVLEAAWEGVTLTERRRMSAGGG